MEQVKEIRRNEIEKCNSKWEVEIELVIECAGFYKCISKIDLYLNKL